jgi:endonuclease/exonuclease/phosphatase family metal-dependent hydrolase
MRVATYNVHGFVGRDRRWDPARIAEVVNQLDCAVVGLQEVDCSGAARSLAEIERVTGLRAVPGFTMASTRGDYGNVVLAAREVVVAVDRYDISLDGREPRGVLAVEVLSERLGVVQVLVTHLGLRRGERRRQARELERIIRARDPERPLVLAGDLNEWWPAAEPLRRLGTVLRSPAAPASFPSWRPLLALDRIWARPPLALREVAAHRSPLARIASDHLPVSATLG